MPELPEVEVARRQLERWLTGAPITAAAAPDPAAVRSRFSTRPAHAAPDGAERWAALVGQQLVVARRHGKRLGLRFDGGSSWIVHLGMTGRWVRQPDPPRFAKLALATAGGTAWFADARRFGCAVPVDDLDAALTEGHGPDALLAPLEPDALAARFRTRKAIKVALMDQDRIAGLGNIQAAEALFRARIAPSRRADALTPAEWSRLVDAIAAQLAYTLGATDAEEVVYMTDAGYVDNPFAVYRRDGDPCGECGTAITQARQAGRVTYWCPSCQA